MTPPEERSCLFQNGVFFTFLDAITVVFSERIERLDKYRERPLNDGGDDGFGHVGETMMVMPMVMVMSKNDDGDDSGNGNGHVTK